VAGIKSEWWPASSRNGGRNDFGIGGRLRSEFAVRSWRKSCDEGGLQGLRRFEAGGSLSRLSPAQEDELSVYVREGLPRSTREVAVFLYQRFGVVYESRSGLIALLHRLGFEYKKPQAFAGESGEGITGRPS
jgi:transposase